MYEFFVGFIAISMILSFLGLFVNAAGENWEAFWVCVFVFVLSFCGAYIDETSYNPKELASLKHGEFVVDNVSGETTFVLFDFPTNTLDSVVEK
jgi:K+-transporting ATPase A subunit